MEARKRSSESGFTLVELLVVIVILGILAAIVVFAVGGITNKGQAAACDAYESTLAAAEEAYFASLTGVGHYTDQDGLVAAKFLHKPSTLHSVALTGGD